MPLGKRLTAKHFPEKMPSGAICNDNTSSREQEEAQMSKLKDHLSECLKSDIKNLFSDIKLLDDHQAIAMLDMVTKHHQDTIKHFRAKINIKKSIYEKDSIK